MELSYTKQDVFCLLLWLVLSLFSASAHAVFINEFHYDNDGGDSGEAIELAGAAGIDLSGWSLVLYNGSGGAIDKTLNLSGIITDMQAGFGTLSFTATAMQNGAPDGVALVDALSNVIQFLSYEGSFTATNGPAFDMISTDIGVQETSSTPEGYSLQLTGIGSLYDDFTWAESSPNSFGAINSGQIFTLPVIENTVTVPEPGSVYLFVLGLFVLGFASWRRLISQNRWRHAGNVPALL